ncbi:hypothetical protein F4777DRAFT_599509 [Nemania sp. FL0916]|nr:hypothetical protein F4777DRAFT_599509 [Nemania sp. FL0916]
MAQTPKKLRIGIVGGGLGGLMTAISINHFCGPDKAEINVYEQAQEYKEIGAGVSLGPNAAKLFREWGIFDEAWAIASKPDVWLTIRRYDNGGEILTIKSNPEAPHLHVHRAELLNLLIRIVKERKAATLHNSKKCISIEEHGETEVITFADGESVEMDLVVGADGIHSRVRRPFLTDGPQYGGMIVYRGVCAVSQLKAWWPFDSYACLWTGPGKYFLMYPISNGTMVNIGAFITVEKNDVGDTTESWTMKGDKSDIAKYFSDWDPTINHVVQFLDDKPLRWVLHDRDLCHQWVFAGGKVVLLGDAAHAMVPHQGAGAGQAVEDSYILGKCLGDFLKESRSHSMEEWLTHVYEAVRLPRAQQVQTTSRENGNNFHFRGDDFKDLSYEAAISVLRNKLSRRLDWIWSSELDVLYDRAVQNLV